MSAHNQKNIGPRIPSTTAHNTLHKMLHLKDLRGPLRKSPDTHPSTRINETTHRINVGANPRQNTPIPSFLYEWTIVDHVERYEFTSRILPSSSPLVPFRWRPALRRRGVPSNRRDVCAVPFPEIPLAELEGASIRGPGPNVGACVDIGTYTGWLPCTRVFTTSKGKVTTQPAIHEEAEGSKG
jgi:hypothetical protein